MKYIRTEPTLLDGRPATIETHVVSPERYGRFWAELIMRHPQSEFIGCGIRDLTCAGARYFGRDPSERIAHGYECYDLSAEHHAVSWLTVRSRNRRRLHLAGVLEWLPMSSEETLLLRVFVRKSFRRQGLATTLVSEAIRQMKKQGYSSALAFVSKDDQRAPQFLASRDFRLVSRGVCDEYHLMVRDLRQ